MLLVEWIVHIIVLVIVVVVWWWIKLLMMERWSVIGIKRGVKVVARIEIVEKSTSIIREWNLLTASKVEGVVVIVVVKVWKGQIVVVEVIRRRMRWLRR